MKAAVIVFPGSNRERDMARALKQAVGTPPAMVWHAETALPAGTELVVLPGGFSYGDYLRCGAIAALSPIMSAVSEHAKRGGLVLGVCNGFQILCEARLLPGVLVRNAGVGFLCKPVHLRVETSASPFTRGYRRGERITVPIAHGEGNWVADSETVAKVEDRGLVAFRYCDERGRVTPGTSPNGATNEIAGLFNARKNVLGLMPHPENAIEPAHGSTDGFGLFLSMAGALADA